MKTQSSTMKISFITQCTVQLYRIGYHYKKVIFNTIFKLFQWIAIALKLHTHVHCMSTCRELELKL